MIEGDASQVFRAMCAGAVARGEGSWSRIESEGPNIGRRIYEIASAQGNFCLGSTGVELGPPAMPVVLVFLEIEVRPPTLKEMLAASMGKGVTLRLVANGIEHSVLLPSLAFVAVLNSLYKVARVAPVPGKTGSV